MINKREWVSRGTWLHYGECLAVIPTNTVERLRAIAAELTHLAEVEREMLEIRAGVNKAIDYIESGAVPARARAALATLKSMRAALGAKDKENTDGR
jgi:hypothetical protein